MDMSRTSLRQVTWYGASHRAHPRLRGFRRGVPRLVSRTVANLMIRDHGADVVVADRLTKVAEHIGSRVERRGVDQTIRDVGDAQPRWHGPLIDSAGYRATPTPRVNLGWSARDVASRVSAYKVYRGATLGNMERLATVGAGVVFLADTTVVSRAVYYYGVTYVDNRGFESDLTISDVVTLPTF